MAGIFARLAAVAALSLMAAACAGAPPADMPSGDMSYAAPSEGGYIEHPRQPLQCVVYARARSNISIYGDAWTWWRQAAGHYPRSHTPQPGAVMVLDRYAGPHRAHLAFVREIVSPRQIVVDHANWLDRGDIHVGDTVEDVSADNDWSEVRVFNLATGAWGTHDYHVRGFIGPNPGDEPVRVAAED